MKSFVVLCEVRLDGSDASGQSIQKLDTQFWLSASKFVYLFGLSFAELGVQGEEDGQDARPRE